MDTIETVRMFCDGQMSMHDVRALVESMGHSREDIGAAFAQLSRAGSMRVGRYHQGEYQAELYLSA